MSSNRLSNTAIALVAIVVIAFALRAASAIFLPFAVAVLFLFVLTPLIHLLQKHLHLPHLLSVFIALLIFIAGGGIVGTLLYSSARAIVSQYIFYQQRFTLLIETIITRYNITELPMAEIVTSLGLMDTLRTFLISSTGNVLSFVSGFSITSIFLLFLLIEQGNYSHRVLKAFGHSNGRKISLASRLIYLRVTRYLTTKVLISIVTALFILVIFSIIGIDFPIVWAILTFLFNFVPSIGSIVITVISVIFAMLQFLPQWGPVIATLVAMGVTQISIGNILEPKLLGDSLHLSPVVIILSLLLWGYLWGITGMFLAVPLTVVIKGVLEQIPAARSIGILMGSSSKGRRR